MTSFKTLLLDTGTNGIATLTINRPDKLNALNADVLNELQAAIGQIVEDDSIRGVIITGSGTKAFVAGADIKELSTLDKSTGKKMSKRGQAVFNEIETCPKPVVAVVNGYALGGGAELAMACHLRIATENAVFGLPEVSLGLIPGYGGTQRLPQLIGKAKALEFILTGRQIKAEQARELGLVNDTASQGKAMETAEKLLSNILKNSPIAISKAIQAVNSAFSTRDGDGFEAEASRFGELCQTEDFKEGTSAFLEKRKADFKGR